MTDDNGSFILKPNDLPRRFQKQKENFIIVLFLPF